MASLGRVLRVDRPSAGLVALTLRTAGRTEVLLLGSHPGAFGAGLVDTRPRGAPADAFAQGLRRRLLGADTLLVELVDGVVFISFLRAEGAEGADGADGADRSETDTAEHDAGPTARDPHVGPDTWLVASRAAGALWLRTAERVVLATHPHEPCPSPPTNEDDARLSRAELVVAGPALVRAAAAELLDSGQRAISLALSRAVKRLSRKRDAILADAHRADSAPTLRLDADLLLAHHNDVARQADGTGWVDVTDWSLAPPGPRRIALGRGETPAARASRLYHQARRMERGARIAEERWALAEEQLEQVRALAARCAAVTTRRELDEVEQAGLALGLRELDDAARPARRQQAGTKGRSSDKRGGKDAHRSPFRRFVSSDGHPIWVGRSARDNDALTLHHAKPHHLWLHVEGRAGSHVIVPLARGAVASSALLVDAAQLAAHFSDARDEALVEVIHAERRHVVKPRGFPAGAVRVDRRKTLLLRQEPARLAALLAAELRI